MSDTTDFPEIQGRNPKLTAIIAIHNGEAILCSLGRKKANIRRRRLALAEKYSQHAKFYAVSLKRDRWDQFLREMAKLEEPANADAAVNDATPESSPQRPFEVVTIKRRALVVAAGR